MLKCKETCLLIITTWLVDWYRCLLCDIHMTFLTGQYPHHVTYIWHFWLHIPTPCDMHMTFPTGPYPHHVTCTWHFWLHIPTPCEINMTFLTGPYPHHVICTWHFRLAHTLKMWHNIIQHFWLLGIQRWSKIIESWSNRTEVGDNRQQFSIIDCRYLFFFGVNKSSLLE
jgi:hypothetical protein